MESCIGSISHSQVIYSLSNWYMGATAPWEWFTRCYTDIMITLRTSILWTAFILVLLAFACLLSWTRKWQAVGLYLTALFTIVLTVLMGGFAMQIGRMFLGPWY